MSSATVGQDYSAGQHAPDPVPSHGDPIPPGKLAIWLFLASEIMFFIGLLGTYIVLRSGSAAMFANQGHALNKSLAALNTLVLIFSSLTMALSVDAAQKRQTRKLAVCLFLTLLMACGFMVIKTIEYSDKFHHYTVLAKEKEGTTTKFYVYDGHRTLLQLTGPGFFLKVPDGTRMVTFKTAQEVPATQPTAKATPVKKDTIGAVLSGDGKTLQVQLDLKGTPTIAVAADAVVDARPDQIKEFWTLHGLRREVGKNEPLNVHIFTPAADPEMSKLMHEGAHAKAADTKPGERGAAPESAADAHEGPEKHYELKSEDINDWTWYGPQKNIFFSCYFAITGVHGLHVVGGIIPIFFLLVQALRGKVFAAQTEYVGLYWHFVDLVWIFLFPLLYLI